MAMEHKRKRPRNDAAAKAGKKRSRSEGHVGDPDETYAGVRSIAPQSLEEGPLSNSESESGEDEEEWAGLPQDGASFQQPSASRGSHKSNRPPTALELRSIKDAADLYRSSSFKLQIDALLPNVRPKYDSSSSLNRFLHSLSDCLVAAPSRPSMNPLDASTKLLKQGVGVLYPHPLPTKETKWGVAFEKPVSISLVGSWQNRCSVKSKDKGRYGVDVAVEMPPTLFQEKDYLQGRFFHKKAYYLAVVAASILSKKSGLDADILYGTNSDDVRLACLVVRPRGEKGKDVLNAEIRIIPVLGADSPIPLQRLASTKSNLRISPTSEGAPDNSATPLYNNAILLSTTTRAHLLRTHTLKQKTPSFDDAHTLLRVWANQRGYGRGSRLCVRGFEGKGQLWVTVLDLVIHGEDPSYKPKNSATKKRKPVGTGLSSYQLFRAALDFLAQSGLHRLRAFVKHAGGHHFPAEDYDAFDTVLVDATSPFNHLAGIPPGSLSLLQRDAKATLDTLNESSLSGDPFNEVFMKDHRDIQIRFDLILRVDLKSTKLRNPSIHATLDQGSPYITLLNAVDSSLRAALGNRAKSVTILHPTSQPWGLSGIPPSGSSFIFVGLILDTEHAFRLVDHGPAADHPDPSVAQAFQELWGEKAELRRFKDGSIVECVVWDVKTSDERAHIPYLVCAHTLKRHCGIPEESLQHWQSSFDNLLRLPKSITSLCQAEGVEMGFKAALAAFDSLVKNIKSLDEELPLAVLNISPASEMLRYTSVFSPVALPDASLPSLPDTARFLQSMEIVIEFEKSARWPDDLRAIQKLKLAFFERLASALMSSVSGLTASVVLGDPSITPDIQDSSSLEIITPQGWAFNARIWHDREGTLLDTAIDDKPHIPQHIKKGFQEGINLKERQIASGAKEVYTRHFEHAPRHHRATAALCHKFSAFAGTVRLVKRWFSSHWLLGGHVSNEVIEILCASVFVGTGKRAPKSTHVVDAPGTKERGFFEVVELLKEWEWEKGLFVPLYSDDADTMPEPSPVAAKGVAWIVATEFDPSGRMWTSHGPDAVVARRIKTIAKGTWDCSLQVEGPGYDVSVLFTHPQEHYDVLVELDSSELPRYSQKIHADPNVWAKKGKYANVQQSQGAVRPGFDPARSLFDDLTRIYADTFKVFYDCLGGDRFGIVWEPSLASSKPFKVLGRFSSAPSYADGEQGKDKLVRLNTDAILSEVERLGAGLVKSITQRQ